MASDPDADADADSTTTTAPSSTTEPAFVPEPLTIELLAELDSTNSSAALKSSILST